MRIKNILLGAFLTAGISASAQDNTITVETAKLGAPVQPTM